jgi:hypothetical protein
MVDTYISIYRLVRWCFILRQGTLLRSTGVPPIALNNILICANTATGQSGSVSIVCCNLTASPTNRRSDRPSQGKSALNSSQIELCAGLNSLGAGPRDFTTGSLRPLNRPGLPLAPVMDATSTGSLLRVMCKSSELWMCQKRFSHRYRNNVAVSVRIIPLPLK